MFSNLHRVPTQKKGSAHPDKRHRIHRKINVNVRRSAVWAALAAEGTVAVAWSDLWWAAAVGAEPKWAMLVSLLVFSFSEVILGKYRSEVLKLSSAGLLHTLYFQLLQLSFQRYSQVLGVIEPALLLCFFQHRSLYRPSAARESHPELISSVLPWACRLPAAEVCISQTSGFFSFTYSCDSSYCKIQILHKHLCTQLYNITVSLANDIGFFMGSRHKGAWHMLFVAM